jgi:hypothetical protein
METTDDRVDDKSGYKQAKNKEHHDKIFPCRIAYPCNPSEFQTFSNILQVRSILHFHDSLILQNNCKEHDKNILTRKYTVQYTIVNCIIRQNQTLRDYSANITYLQIPFLSLWSKYPKWRKTVHVVFVYLQMLCNDLGVQSQGTDPPPLCKGRHVKIIWMRKLPTPLLPTGIDERYSQTISNLGHTAPPCADLNSP